MVYVGPYLLAEHPFFGMPSRFLREIRAKDPFVDKGRWFAEGDPIFIRMGMAFAN